jgi:hypothetical protein
MEIVISNAKVPAYRQAGKFQINVKYPNVKASELYICHLSFGLHLEFEL